VPAEAGSVSQVGQDLRYAARTLARSPIFTTAAVIVTLGATALLASIVPAWRAAAVDPLIALRAD